jgi:hypothetical protein
MAYIDQSIVINKENLGPFEDISWDELHIDFDTLCKDKKLLASITFTRSVREVYIRRNEAAIERFEEVKEILQQELKN